jgi:hypothetical protein
MRETVRNACELHALLEGYPALAGPRGVHAVCLCPPGSNIVCYAFRPDAPADLACINRLNRAVYDQFSLGRGARVHEHPHFVSRTSLTPAQYPLRTVADFLGRLGVPHEQYQQQGVFLLRSVLMNPWYGAAKARARYFLAELVESLYAAAGRLGAPAPGAADPGLGRDGCVAPASEPRPSRAFKSPFTPECSA